MDTYSEQLNYLFEDTFNNILRLEEQTLRQAGRIHLTISEMHLIECVGKGMPEGRTIRELAKELRVKPPSITVAVKKLEAKGCVTKAACASDGRSVRVQLTREGRRMNAYHKYYHRMMVKSVSADLDETEREILLRAVTKLNKYFAESVEAMQ